MDIKPEKIDYYIVKLLLKSDVFLRKYASKLSPDLFPREMRFVVNAILIFHKKYNRLCPVNILQDMLIPKLCKDNENFIQMSKIELDKVESIEDFTVVDMVDVIKEDVQNFIKTRKFLIAYSKIIPLLSENKHEDARLVMEDVFKVSFDEKMGLDYWEDLQDRYDRCDRINEFIPTHLKELNDLIGGGYRRKALFVYAGPPNVGKSLVLNDAASSLSLQGYNVLYITLELAEDYISQRTDAKIGEFAMNQLNMNPKAAIKKIMAKRDILKQQNKDFGKLIYKEYSANEASCNDFKNLIREYEQHFKIKFDFVIIDYLKLIKAAGKIYGDNMYLKLGTVCEELRALAREFDVCVLTATATDKQSMNSDSIKMNNVSDSIAIVQTADVLITLARDQALDASNLILVSVVKSRFSRNNGQLHAKIDYDYMRLVENDLGIKKQPTDRKPINDVEDVEQQPDDFA